MSLRRKEDQASPVSIFFYFISVLGLLHTLQVFNIDLTFLIHYSVLDGLLTKIYQQFSLISEIWDALRAAAEAELSLAQAIIDSAGVIVQNADLTVCYDERGPYHCFIKEIMICYFSLTINIIFIIANLIAGAKYELPKYVLSEPTNLIRDSS